MERQLACGAMIGSCVFKHRYGAAALQKNFIASYWKIEYIKKKIALSQLAYNNNIRGSLRL